jgi:hypothetical protein
MPTRFASFLAVAWALAACSPALDWREVRVEPGLAAMLPCKPDKGARIVPMAGRQVQLDALSCDAGGATFALLSANIVDAGRAGQVLAQWKTATLANLRSTAARESAFLPPGALNLRESLQVIATGQRANGSKVESHAAYFARGSHVFQAVIYAERLQPEMAESFFSGLKFQ